MKKYTFIHKMKIPIVLLILLGISIMAIASQAESTITATPLDGHYAGKTSQNQDISFNIISGKIRDIEWTLDPLCNKVPRTSWSFGGFEGRYYGNTFTWNYSVNDRPGELDSIRAKSEIFVLGSGQFDTTTHAKGRIRHGLAYYTGTLSDLYSTSNCINNSITYEVNRVSTNPSPATKKRITIEQDQQGQDIIEIGATENIATVVPLNGHYAGETSQNVPISFDVISGQIRDINWELYTCDGLLSFNYHSGGVRYGEIFAWNRDVNDKPGELDGIVPLSGSFVLGSGQFDTTTHAKGRIRNGAAYYIGDKISLFKTSNCVDNSVTYEVNRVSASPSSAQKGAKNKVTIELER